MTPEEHDLLIRTYNLCVENNKILDSLRRSSRLAVISRFVYWGVILVLSLGAYYFIQPYIDTLTSVYGSGFSNLPANSQSLKDLLK